MRRSSPLGSSSRLGAPHLLLSTARRAHGPALTPCCTLSSPSLSSSSPARSAFHKAQVYLARTLNLPILVTLALHARLSHRAGGAPGSGAIALARDLPRRFGSWDIWDSKVEHVVEEVWERAVTDEGRRVASFDEPAGEERREGGGRAAEALGEGDARASTDSSTSKSKDKGKAGAGAGAGAGPKARPPALKPHAQRPSPAKRLGSLDSPLARLFGPGASLGAGPSAAAAGAGGGGRAGEGGGASAGASGGVEARLGRIEEALGVLLGEVIKSGGVGRGGSGGAAGEDGGDGEEEEKRKSVPLTSLTGMVEPSYADDGNE